MGLEFISHENLTIAIIIRSDFQFKDNINFVTKDDDILQLGYMKRSKDHKVKRHFHNTFDRKISKTNEVIILKKGSFKINFFTENNEFIKTLEVNKNDILLIQNGAHELEMTEDCEFYEIKNGPYFINKDKSFIE